MQYGAEKVVNLLLFIDSVFNAIFVFNEMAVNTQSSKFSVYSVLSLFTLTDDSKVLPLHVAVYRTVHPDISRAGSFTFPVIV